MKKTNIILASLLCITLSSCNIMSKNDTSFNIKDWSTKLIDQNLVEEEEDQYKNVSYGTVVSKSFESNEIYDSRYAQQGLLVINTVDNKMGFYSLIYNNWLVYPMNISYDFNYSLSLNSYVGYTLMIRNNNMYYYYDALGNEIYSGDNGKNVFIGKEKINDKEHIYCEITDSMTQDHVKYYYDENGILDSTTIIGEDKYEVGDKYYDVDIIKEFEGFSIEGYKFSMDLPMITVYKENGEFVSSYSVPALFEISEGYYFAGESLVYQVHQIVASDSKEYDYCQIQSYNNSGLKYVIKTYRLNLLNGKQKEINIDFVIANSNSVESFKNEKGQSEYALLDAIFLNKDKTIGDASQVIVDEKGNVIANASGFYPKDFIKLDNGNYYNLKNEILYSSSLKVIAHLGGIDPVYYRGIGFVGTMYGKYGVINESGNVALPFEYDSIDRYSYNNKVIAIKGDFVYKLDLSQFRFSSFAERKEFSSLGDGLYAINKENYQYFIDIQNELLVVDKNKYNTSYIGKMNFEFGKYQFMYTTDKETNERSYKVFSSKKVPNSTSFIPHGEKYTEPSNPSVPVSNYSVINDSSYPFTFDGYTYSSTNHDHDSTSKLTIVSNYNQTISFNYEISSESSYDRMIVSLNSTQYFDKSGSYSGTLSYNLSAGDSLIISYSKDGSSSSGEDCIKISNISVY